VVLSSAIFVMMWGWFLYQGVTDPLGGINSLLPMFGIANQLLAAVALCVGTTVIVKMGKARYAWMTLLPLAWLAVVTLSAGAIKIFSSVPRLGFLAHARLFDGMIAAGTVPPGVASLEAAQRMAFNDRLNAAVVGFFMVCVVVIIVASAYEWFACVSGRKRVVSTEVEYSHTRDFVIQAAG